MDLTDRIFARALGMGLRKQLPELSGLSRQRVDAIQRGADYTTTEFERLCRALAVDPVVLYRGGETDPRRSPARFRAAISTGRPTGADLRLLALATEVGITLGHLAERLGRPNIIPQRRRVVPVDASNAGPQGYDLGHAARAALTGDDGPLDSLTGTLRSLGVHVVGVRFRSDGIDGASIWTPGALPVILINRSSGRAGHPGALRATLAHELGHLLHDAGEADLTTVVSWGWRGNHAERIEARARGFAPAFLAPRAAVQAWAAASTFDDDEQLVHALARRWGLSFEGAAWHAKNCHLIEYADARRLAHMDHKPHITYDCDESLSDDTVGDPSACPGPLWRGLAAELVQAAQAEELISPGRAEELLTWA